MRRVQSTIFWLQITPLPLSLSHWNLQAVPAYIEKANWGNLAESLEVYSLLDQIADARQEFPTEVSCGKQWWVMVVSWGRASKPYHFKTIATFKVVFTLAV